MTGAVTGVPLPLSYAQQALWLLHRVNPASPAYHTGAALQVSGDLDLAALERALDGLARRHDMLRSGFRQDGARPVRVVHAHRTATLAERRPAGRPDGERPGEAARRLLNEPFDLGAGAFRFTVLRGAPRRSLLVMAAHHIATDALSNWVLIRDLFDLLADPGTDPVDLVDPADPANPAAGPVGGSRPATYQDFVRREAELLASDRGADLERHWRAVCAGAVPAELPLDGPRPGTGAGRTVRLRVAGAELAAVREAAAASEVTLFAFLLASFQGLLARSGNPGPFLVGCPTSVRTGRDVREVVGNFVNTLVFRGEVPAGTTYRDLAARAQDQVGSGLRAAGYPFALVTRAVNPPRAGGAPLCRILFNVLGVARPDPLLRLLLDPEADGGPVERGGLLVRPLVLPQSEGKLDLSVNVQQSRDSMTVEFRYDTSLFDRTTIERLAAGYRHVLTLAAHRPDREVAGAEPEQRDPEQRDAEQRDAEQRDAEQRDAEQRDAEQRDAEQRDAEQRDAPDDEGEGP